MKFLLCIVLCFVAAQASVIGLGGAVAPVASVYSAPLAYSSYLAAAPVVGTYSASTIYNRVASPLVGGVYSAPAVYAAPSVYSTLLKK